MHRNFIVFLLLIGGLVTACSGAEEVPTTTPEPTAAIIPATLPAPDVAVAPTNSPLPIPSATLEPVPTAISQPTDTPAATAPPTAIPLGPVPSLTLEPIITEGLQKITFLTHAFDERLFVLEQGGRIRIIQDGQLLEQPFLDITDRVGSLASEQGLLGLAFHPDYATSGAAGEGRFFVNYTDYSGNTHISRFSVSEDDPNQANPASEVDYLTQEQPFPNHNGGSLAFGPDGYLYAGLGDGGSANDPLQAGQDLTTVLGKVLRLDVDSAADEYTTPPDNPFAGVEGVRPEIWAYGLRNPWRFSFDRETGDFFIADVGQNQWEEVNFQPANSPGGENYGWQIMEANHCVDAAACDQTDLIAPIFEYDHTMGCSITGGYVYRGSLYPTMVGNYFVSDYCSGTIWRLFLDGDQWVSDIVQDTELIVSSLGEDAAGELYLLNYWAGTIFRVQAVE